MTFSHRHFVLCSMIHTHTQTHSVYLSIFLSETAGMGLENNNIVGEMPGEVCQMVVDNDVDVWADCSDVSGEDPLLCACCSVCCPGDSCV